MASRQMAFQVSGYEYMEFLKVMVRLGDVDTLKAWIAQIKDEQRQRRMQACVLIAAKSNQMGHDPLQVKKIVCWRDDDGKPGKVEAEFYRCQA